MLRDLLATNINDLPADFLANLGIEPDPTIETTETGFGVLRMPRDGFLREELDAGSRATMERAMAYFAEHPDEFDPPPLRGRAVAQRQSGAQRKGKKSQARRRGR